MKGNEKGYDLLKVINSKAISEHTGKVGQSCITSTYGPMHGLEHHSDFVMYWIFVQDYITYLMIALIKVMSTLATDHLTLRSDLAN